MIFGFLGTGMMVECLKQEGTSHSSSDLLSSIASVCCAAVRFVIVALLFIESLPYFHSVV